MSNIESTPAQFHPLVEEILDRFGDFICGIPIAFTIIPFSIFLLSPDEKTGIFFLGILFSTIIIISSKLTQKNNMELTTDSTIGICIGYLVGYFIMNHINNSNPGSLISSIIIGVILLLSITKTTNGNFIGAIGGYLLGITIGLCFSHLYYKKKINKQKLKNKN